MPSVWRRWSGSSTWSRWPRSPRPRKSSWASLISPGGSFGWWISAKRFHLPQKEVGLYDQLIVARTSRREIAFIVL